MRASATPIVKGPHPTTMSNSILDSTPAGFPERLFISALDHKPMERMALRALMKATRLLSLALGQRLAEMRTSDDAKENALAMAARSVLRIDAWHSGAQ